jgi:tetratricopeptide (TPR) repeat protein
MLFEHRYAGSSGVQQGDAATAMSFQPDTLREPTFFRGEVRKQVEFREAISALHDVVTSDLRFIPQDRTAYLAWREQQSYVDLAQITASQRRISEEIAELQRELGALEARSSQRRAGFYAARQRYFNYLYNRDKELWFKLDPVITVHPDQVFFECFSRDESSYGRLAASYEVFAQLGDRACGTTNIDYSEKLYGEFQKIRSYKTTTLDVDPGGFNVQTSMEDQYREVKIDLPDSWVRGFLQVSSAATLPAHVVELHPMDVHNLCFVLRRNKELFGPRSLRFQLVPGAPVAVIVDPWGTRIDCPRSRYLEPRSGDGSGSAGGGGGDGVEIRVWGRRRLFILERLLPRARRVRLFLLGTGLPTFWVVDLGDLSFTLGLSGWTHNNWSEAGNFDLMAAREAVDTVTQARVFDELGRSWLATPEELAARTGLATPIVASALAGWVQAGRAIFDLDRGVYRKRELTREPLPLEKLRFANPREERAAELLHRAKISIDTADAAAGGLRLAGRIKDRNRTFAAELTFDADRRLVAGECSCDFFVRNRLHKGPCEHMLALRAAHRRGISDRISFEAPSGGPGRSAAAREAAADRESFQAAFRKAVLRATELRSAGRAADSIRELERMAKLAPPDSDEHARLSEVIAESHLEIDQFQAAISAADRALRRFPASPLALRVKRDALIRLDEVAAAIEVARALAGAEDTVERWNELVRLCHQAEYWSAMYQFAQEGLRRHPRTPRLAAAVDMAASQGGTGPEPAPGAGAARAGAGTAPASADAGAAAGGGAAADAPKANWWRRTVNKLTGKGPRVEDAVAAAAGSVDAKLGAIADELERRATVTDRRTLLQVLRIAHAGADDLDGRIASMIRALRQTNAVLRLPADKDLTALLRRLLA